MSPLPQQVSLSGLDKPWLGIGCGARVLRRDGSLGRIGSTTSPVHLPSPAAAPLLMSYPRAPLLGLLRRGSKAPDQRHPRVPDMPPATSHQRILRSGMLSQRLVTATDTAQEASIEGAMDHFCGGEGAPSMRGRATSAEADRYSTCPRCDLGFFFACENALQQQEVLQYL